MGDVLSARAGGVCVASGWRGQLASAPPLSEQHPCPGLVLPVLLGHVWVWLPGQSSALRNWPFFHQDSEPIVLV